MYGNWIKLNNSAHIKIKYGANWYSFYASLHRNLMFFKKGFITGFVELSFPPMVEVNLNDKKRGGGTEL